MKIEILPILSAIACLTFGYTIGYWRGFKDRREFDQPALNACERTQEDNRAWESLAKHSVDMIETCSTQLLVCRAGKHMNFAALP